MSTLNENEKDKNTTDLLIKSIGEFAYNQYGMIKAYEGEKKCSFEEALLNCYLGNKIKYFMN
jgi:hypothetical protein